MFQHGLAVTLKLRPLILRIMTCWFPALGSITLLPKVKNHELSIVMALNKITLLVDANSGTKYITFVLQIMSCKKLPTFSPSIYMIATNLQCRLHGMVPMLSPSRSENTDFKLIANASTHRLAINLSCMGRSNRRFQMNRWFRFKTSGKMIDPFKEYILQHIPQF